VAQTADHIVACNRLFSEFAITPADVVKQPIDMFRRSRAPLGNLSRQASADSIFILFDI